MVVEKRNIGLCIVLSIITCGIYELYWMAKLNDDSNEIIGNNDYTTGGMTVLLTIITCGIYGIYWSYKLGERVDRLRTINGYSSGSLPVLYLVLSIFRLDIINLALAQSEINQYAV